MNQLRSVIPLILRRTCRAAQPSHLQDVQVNVGSFNLASDHRTTSAKLHFTTSAAHAHADGSVMKKLMRQIGFSDSSKSRIKRSSYVLYESVADNINYADFFMNFDLPDTFNSWFIVTELHVWMLLVRSMAEGSESGEDGRFLRNCIVEAMWADVTTRAKKLGAANPSGTRAQIQVLAQQFQAALINYDEGITSDDKTLAAALWRRFFNQKCNDFVLLEGLVKYVRKQTQELDATSRDNFLIKTQIKWIRLNDL